MSGEEWNRLMRMMYLFSWEGSISVQLACICP